MPPLRRFRLALFAAIVFAIPTTAQNYVPPQPDNTLTPADPIGITPKPSAAGTYEAVNDLNGGLSFFLPTLTLPQRGGWNLTLGYYNTSPQWHVHQDVSVVDGYGAGNNEPTNLNYTDSLEPFQGGLNINLPTLRASIEYTGEDQYNGNNYPVLCLTNWVFSDWSGIQHQFSNITVCSMIQAPGATASTLAEVTDSSDGSWLRLDTTNYSTTGITVRTKDGTLYTFPGFGTAWPYPPCDPSTMLCSQTASTTQISGNPWYNSTFTSMVDSTGNNSLCLRPNGTACSQTQSYQFVCGSCTLTDTIGRTITIGNSGITYTDSSGTQQTVQVASTQQSAQTYNLGDFACTPQKPGILVNVTATTGTSSFSLNPYIYTVTFPQGRVYTLQFDGLWNLAQVTYPSGGYTKYVFPNPNTTSFTHQQGGTVCMQPQQEITQKRQCPLFNGSCSSAQELVTTYTPVADTSGPFNDQSVIQDAAGDVTQAVNQNLGSYPFIAAHEVTRYIYASGNYTGPCGMPPCGTPLRTIQTVYTPYVGGVDVQVPSQVTTTLNDISPSKSAVTNYQYETVLLTCGPDCSGGTVAINNPTEIDEYDYTNSGTGVEIRKTTQSWETGSTGIYSISYGHLLDRLASRTVTDPSSNNQETLSYGYNSVGDITSKTVGGTGVTSLTTSYQRDAYRNITQMTDPRGNVTNWGYTNNWANSGCSISAPSAYLTSITDALGHVSKFSYYPCTGLKAAAQNPNDIAAGRAGTTFTYDALGRPLNTTRPDGGQTNDSYVDTAPNTVTESSSITITPPLLKTTVTILDGLGRTSQTQLTSDPDGVDYVDTTYDSVGEPRPFPIHIELNRIRLTASHHTSTTH